MPRSTIALPDFLLIGAQKAGTSSFANILGQHPGVTMASVKEPMFFGSNPKIRSADKESSGLHSLYFAHYLSEYSALFRSSSPDSLLGEASTAYLANPIEAAKWIRKLVPDAKIIAVLRHPVERAFSAYKMYYGQGLEKRPFREIVDRTPGLPRTSRAWSGQHYVELGIYSQLLLPYYEYFPKEQLLMIDYDTLSEHPKGVFDRTFSFLGLPLSPVNTGVRINTAAAHLGDTDPGDETASLRQLASLFVPEIEATARLTGLDLSRWIGRCRSLQCA